MMSMIQNSRPCSDHLPTMNERAGRQERGEIMSMIQNARPWSDHLPTLNERAGRQEREEVMSMIQNARLPSDHLPPKNERTRRQEEGKWWAWFRILDHDLTTYRLWMREQGGGREGKWWAWFRMPDHNQTTYLLQIGKTNVSIYHCNSQIWNILVVFFTLVCGHHDAIPLTNSSHSLLLSSPMEPCFSPTNGSRTL